MIRSNNLIRFNNTTCWVITPKCTTTDLISQGVLLGHSRWRRWDWLVSWNQSREQHPLPLVWPLQSWPVVLLDFAAVNDRDTDHSCLDHMLMIFVDSYKTNFQCTTFTLATSHLSLRENWSYHHSPRYDCFLEWSYSMGILFQGSQLTRKTAADTLVHKIKPTRINRAKQFV